MGEQRGFSLLELMVAVAIVGILVAIALPAYQKQILKGNRSAAQAMLMDVAQKEQQYFLDARTYMPIANCQGLTALGINVDPKVQQYYLCTVTVTPGPTPPPTFIARATPPASSKQYPDGELSIDQASNKLPTDKW